MTTLHANTPRDMLRRLETMVLMTGYDLPLRAIREQVASAFDVIVHQSRFRDGSRRITHVTEVESIGSTSRMWPVYGGLVVNLRNIVDAMDEVAAANPMIQPPLPFARRNRR